MIKSTILLLLLGACFTTNDAANCQVTKPVTFTTLDASILTTITYIAQFKLTCPDVAMGQNLYAVEDSDGSASLSKNGWMTAGRVVTKSNEEDLWQVSWFRDIPLATTGAHTLKLYTEDGLAQLRKYAKSGTGSQPVPIASVVVNHPGAYNGPWLSSEHVAAVMGVVGGWLAIGWKGRLLA